MIDRLKAYGSAKVLIIAESQSSVETLLKILDNFDLSFVDLKTQDESKHILTANIKYDLVFVSLSQALYQNNCQLIQAIRKQQSEEYIPLIGLLSASDDQVVSNQIKQQALASGITDLIVYPTSDVALALPSEVDTFAKDFATDNIDISLRISTLLEARSLYKSSKALNQYLEDLVVDKTDALVIANADLAHLNSQVDKSNDEIFERLARAAEFRDDTTGKHTERVGNLAARIALRLGMQEDFVQLISKAARLHDLGKIGIPDKILLKPSRFTPEERDLMMQHCEIGAELLSGSESPLLNMAQRIAMSHHEKWNGEGYPNKLVAQQIPIEGRIVAVADVYDALSHDRPYKQAWAKEEVLQLLGSKRGIHFDPNVIDALFEIVAPDMGPDTGSSGSVLPMAA